MARVIEDKFNTIKHELSQQIKVRTDLTEEVNLNLQVLFIY